MVPANIQKLHLALMAVCSWWMVIAVMREELRYAKMEVGQLSHTLTGTTMMPEWCAGSWDTMMNVRMHFHFHTV